MDDLFGTHTMPAWHFSGVSHHHHRSQQVDHDFAGAVPTRYSTRRGSYRIVYRIDDKTRTVTVGDVAHRSAAYKLH